MSLGKILVRIEQSRQIFSLMKPDTRFYARIYQNVGMLSQRRWYLEIWPTIISRRRKKKDKGRNTHAILELFHTVKLDRSIVMEISGHKQLLYHNGISRNHISAPPTHPIVSVDSLKYSFALFLSHRTQVRSGQENIARSRFCFSPIKTSGRREHESKHQRSLAVYHHVRECSA